MLALKDMTLSEKRKILETKLWEHALNKFRTFDLEKINTYTGKNDDHEIGLVKGFGFNQVAEGKEWRLFELPIKK
jgi:ribosomal protein S18 acetylase RimI-like enzyme